MDGWMDEWLDGCIDVNNVIYVIYCGGKIRVI